jgi:DNA repair exonuclease SbcCD ATPase subunit
MGDEPYRRFHFSEEYALSILGLASVSASALFALEQHLQLHTDWLARASEKLTGATRREDDQAKDARAAAAAQMERMKALRKDIVELAADAESMLPDAAANEIVIPRPMPDLPQTFGAPELMKVQKSFAKGTGHWLREATRPLRKLREHLNAAGDEQSRALADRIDAFIETVHGPRSETA